MQGEKNCQGFWRISFIEFIKNWGLKITLVVFSLFWLTLVAAAWSNAGSSHLSTPDIDEEFNFDWLDRDKKIYVLQNRKYTKSGHAFFTALAGTGFSNPYRSTYSAEGRIGFYISEMFGLEGFYNYTFNVANTTIYALGKASPNALPNIREIRSQFGGLLHFSPWYAKINVFNQVLYFDWYFTTGIGGMQTLVDTRTKITDPSIYVQQDLVGYYLGTGHQFHLSQTFFFRLDITGAFYLAPINGITGETAWYSNFVCGAGLGWRI